MPKLRQTKKNRCEEIFISFAYADEAIGRSLKIYLDSLGFNCFLAPFIPKGSDYPKEVMNALERVDVFIPILSVEGLESLWVQHECGFASCIKHLKENLGKIYVIIPILEKGSEAPAMIKRRQGIPFAVELVQKISASGEPPKVIKKPIINTQTFREIANSLKDHWKPSDLMIGLLKKLGQVNDPGIGNRLLEFIGTGRDLTLVQFKKLMLIIKINQVILAQPSVPGILGGGLSKFESRLTSAEKRMAKSLIKKSKNAGTSTGGTIVMVPLEVPPSA